MATINGIPGFVDLYEAAEIIGVSYAQVCRYIEDGLLPARKIGAVQRVVRRKDAESFERPPRGNPEFRKQKSA